MSDEATIEVNVDAVRNFFKARTGLKWITNILLASTISSILFWFLFLNHIPINHIGVAYNMSSGKVHVQDEPGWYITNPVTFVYDIDTLPMKVELPSEAKVINVKYVRFKKEGVEEFIQLQGFNYISGSSSLQNVLMGYAFSGRDWPFLEVVSEADPESTILPSGLSWPKESEKYQEVK